MFTFKVLNCSDFDLEIYYICNTDKFIILMIMFLYKFFLSIICNI